MNDFTKEELQELLYALDCCHITPVGVKSPPLMLKIQSILDNYCEHSEKTYSRKTGKPVCPICHHHFGDNGDDIESRLKGYVNDNQ